VYGCGRYTDNNGDGFCDYSFVSVPEKQEPPKPPAKDSIASKTIDTPAVAYKAEGAGKVTEQAQPSGREGTEPKGQFRSRGGEKPARSAVDPATTLPGSTQQQGVVVSPPLVSQYVPGHHEPVYDLIFVSAITLGLYFTTLILYRRKVITRIHHRKFWNLMLLLTFLVSCLFGFFLVIQINYDVAMNAYKTLLYWHVEIGIAMTLVAVVHILWHLTYFKNLVAKKW